MLTVKDINKAEFEKAVRGYRPQDVDNFLNEVADTISQLNKQLEDAVKEKQELLEELESQKEIADQKLYTLAEKIEQYRADEDNLGAALLSAQRISESVTAKAKDSAQDIINDAKIKASKILEDVKSEYAREENRLAKLRAEVGKFKADVLYLYKFHIEQLNALPVMENEKSKAPVEESKTIAVEPTIQEENVEVQTQETIEESAVMDEIPTIEENDEITKTFEEKPQELQAESFEDYLGVGFDDE